VAAFGIQPPLESSLARPDPYDENFKNVGTIIDSGDSQLTNAAEDRLRELADKARRVKKRKGGFRDAL